MRDKEKFQLAQKNEIDSDFSALFSKSFMDMIPAAKAINWLHEHNTVFVFMPTSDTCLESIVSNGGVAPYFVRFLCFGEEASLAVKTLGKENPLLTYQKALSSKNDLCQSQGFTLFQALTYKQFIELIEHCCSYLEDKHVTIKRFEVSIDFEIGGKMTYTSLPLGETFYSFLEGYEGEADLYDKSFVHYVGEMMSENLKIEERPHGHIKPPES